MHSKRGGTMIAMPGRRPGRLWRFRLTTADRAALEKIGSHYAHTSVMGAVRFCLSEQQRRDAAGYDAAGEQRLWRLRSTAIRMLQKARFANDFAGLDDFSGWFHDREFAAMAAIRERWSLDCDAAAVRLAVRTQAEADGFFPAAGW